MCVYIYIYIYIRPRISIARRVRSGRGQGGLRGSFPKDEKWHSRNESRDLMLTEIGWTSLYYPMLALLTWIILFALQYLLCCKSCPAYIHNTILFYKTMIPDTRVLVPPMSGAPSAGATLKSRRKQQLFGLIGDCVL